MIFDVTDCEEAIGYEFKDKNLLRQCFTHPSYSNENKSSKSNERLEFLGDSILGFVVSDYLFAKIKDNEGVLTSKKQKYVSGKILASETKKLALNKFLLLGAGNGADQNKDSVCENLFESVIAGLYLDGGLEVAKKFILRTVLSEKVENGQDAKSELQIFCQKRKLGKVEYVMLSRSGPDHEPTFKIGVFLEKKQIAEAVGGKKSVAEQLGAKQALNNLKRRK